MPKYVVQSRPGGVFEILELRGSIDANYYVPVLTARNFIDAVSYAAKLNKESK